MTVGISNIAYDIPKIYLDIEEFSKHRNIEADKLKKGLGLYKMAICDVHQDTATMAANALYKLIINSDIDPTSIQRIYLGTESALDSSKPTSTYSVEMVENKIGKRVFKHTDVVDMTFACIGAVDVFHNALDYIKANPDHKAVVIASDYAKYDLESSGEYTQGAGAVALLIEANPKLMAFDGTFGIGFKSEHDFFKPRRHYPINDVTSNYTQDKVLQVYREEPVFDGQFSNACYQDRIREAYYHLKELKNTSEILYNNWTSLIFHLPYAYHGKRIFTEIYKLEKDGVSAQKITPNSYSFDELKAIAKSDDYQEFVAEKIHDAQKASSQIGNMYASSIFMSLVSDLFYKKDTLNVNDTYGFLAYGSGSKSKVFEGKIVHGFKKGIEQLELDKTLGNRTAIDFNTYLSLHTKSLSTSVVMPRSEFVLKHIDDENSALVGRRYYDFVE